MKTSPSRLILAGTALLTASSHVEGVEASNKIQKVQTNEVATKKEEEVHAFASVLVKEPANPAIRGAPSPSDAGHKDTTKVLPKQKTKLNSRGRSKTRAVVPQDFGELGTADGSVKDESTHQKKRLRSEFSPYAIKHTTHMHQGHFHRHLYSANSSCGDPTACENSYPICVKNASCNAPSACSDSPGLHAEEYSCNAEDACRYSPNIIVGTGSCTGRTRMSKGSCGNSPDGCIGRNSCRGSQSCAFSRGIQVSSFACGADRACRDSPGATIETQSCNEVSSCQDSPNITIARYSCSDVSACFESSGAIIGQYACNCYNCCQGLSPNCTIPDFECNGNTPYGNCSFDFDFPNCPF